MSEMQRPILNLRPVAPIAVALVALLLVVELFGPGRGAAIDPTFGLTALAGLFGGAINLTIGLLPIVLVVALGYFLTRWWLAGEDSAGTATSWGAVFAGAPAREVTCPNCATPVKDGWQACPSCGYRMHVIVATPSCDHCHHPVDRTWAVCPHCASALPKAPDEQRVPARQMVEAARRYNQANASSLPAAGESSARG